MQNSVQTRIGSQHLKRIAGCRVTLKNTGDIFTQLFDTHLLSPSCVVLLPASEAGILFLSRAFPPCSCFCTVASIPRRMFTSVLSIAARWYRRRMRKKKDQQPTYPIITKEKRKRQLWKKDRNKKTLVELIEK